MKFIEKHFNSLLNCVENALHERRMKISEFKREYNGKSETRFLWDLFWVANWAKYEREHYLEGDYADSHIQTAMKNVVKLLLEREQLIEDINTQKNELSKKIEAGIATDEEIREDEEKEFEFFNKYLN